MTLYLKNASFVNWQTLEITITDLAVEENTRDGLSFLTSMPAPASIGSQDRILDCTGKWVTKSFGCGHHHIYSTLARGMPAPQKTPENFPEILQYVWWHLDKRLDLEMIEASALASAVYCAKNGVTFVIDHHASPFAIRQSLATIAEAFDQTLNAIRNLHVDIIGHPTGRLIPDREAADLDMEAIFAAAAEMGTVLEISAHPLRLDLNDSYARRAAELGILLSINTDAHEPDHLDLQFFGVAIARRGWVPPEQVINTWEPEKLLKWLQNRR